MEKAVFHREGTFKQGGLLIDDSNKRVVNQCSLSGFAGRLFEYLSFGSITRLVQDLYADDRFL